MGYRHDREDVLEAAVQVAGDFGLGQLTFRAIGRRIGIADRTVVYYFPTKTDLLTAVLRHSAVRLVAMLAPAVGDERVTDSELLAASWAVLKQPEADPWVRLYVETLGLAVRGTEPYTSIAAELARTWVPWFAAHLLPGAMEEPADDRAAALLASLDGLILLHTAIGPDVAILAARGLGIPPRT